MKRLMAVLLAVWLTGCATNGTEKVDQIAAGAKILPLSMMGSTLNVKYIGTTVFNNAQNTVDVSAWQVDKFAEASAARAVAAGGRFVPVTGFDTAPTHATKLDVNTWAGTITLAGGAPAVAKLAQDARADYVLLIAPMQMGDPFFGTNQSFSGYGIGERSMFTTQRAVNYLTVQAVLLDGKTGEALAKTRATDSDPRPASDWMENDKLVPGEANAAATKASIETMLDRTLKKSLTELKVSK